MATKGEATRGKILAKTVRLYNQQGIGSTSLNDIIAVMGMTKGSLYFHFRNKEELTQAVLREAKTVFGAFLDSALTGKTPGAKLDNFFRQALEKHRRTGFVGGCIFGNVALETSDRDRQSAKLVGDVFGDWIGRIRTTVRESQAAGQVRDDLSADMLARHIVMAIEGGIMLARLEKDERYLKDCLKSLRVMIGLKR